jgi:hypothetical protein
VVGHPAGMSGITTKALTRGARALIYRDGHDLECAVEIPAEGAFTVRHLAPGQYTARDSCGGEQTFTVTPDEEVTTILRGSTFGVTGGPGSSGVVESPALRVGPGGGLITAPDQVAAEAPVAGGEVDAAVGADPAETLAPVPKPELAPNRPKDPGAEVRVLGGAGAARVQEAPVRLREETMEVARAEREGEVVELDAGEPEVLPRTVKPDPVGPAPERSTELAPGEGGSSSDPTPLEGRNLGDPQPKLGSPPVE